MATNDAKEMKKANRAAKRAQRKQTRSQMWQAFKLQRSRDSKLVPYMALGFFGPIILLLLLGLLIGGVWPWVLTIIGISIGFMAAMYIFSKRLEASFYTEAEGQAGAAAWTLDNMRQGVGYVWHVKTGVVANQHMDAVHRVIGNAGVVLVGEGDPNRVKQMIAREKKSLARIAGEAPIYDMIAGSDEGQVPPKKLQRELMRLPRNLNKDQANALNERIQSMDRIRDARANMPKGPMPKGANPQAGMNRRARRAANRGKKH